jgi:LCP family protein required for cell wall assembly
MKIRKPILITISILATLILVAGIASVLYLNSMFNLLDRTAITGDPNIAESDLLDEEDMGTVTDENETEDTNFTDESEQLNTSQESSETLEPVITETSAPTAETTTSPKQPTQTAKPTTTAVQSTLLNEQDVFNILLVGADTRGSGFEGRSDSMIVLSINRRTHKIHMVSLARNLVVGIQGHGNTLLSYSYSWGGMPLLLKTIKDNLRLDLKYYLVINFSGFKKAIDYCGGVDISLTSAEVHYMYLAFPHSSFKVGTNHLNGEKALVYARIRWIDSDYSRTGRQRKVINNLIAKLKTKSPAQIDSLMRKVLPLMRTNLSNKTLLELSIAALQFKSYPISQLLIPIDTSHTTISGYNGEKNIEALHHFLYED